LTARKYELWYLWLHLRFIHLLTRTYVSRRSFALSEINRLKANGHDIQAAIASRTDEPRWARICLDHLVIEDGNVLQDCFPEHLREISYDSKSKHLQRLHQKTGIPFEEMCFFDNEHHNIKDVSKSLPGVKCFYTPDGMTRKAWDDAKADFGLSDQDL
jgi:magnesium-dependent phosphatase 1